jgi:hypothetical protein
MRYIRTPIIIIIIKDGAGKPYCAWLRLIS